MEFLKLPQQLDLVGRVKRLSESGRLDWQPLDEDNEYEFTTIVQKTFYILESVDRDDLHPFRLTVLLRRQSDAEFEEIQGIATAEDTPELNSLLASLYGHVKRDVFGVDEVVSTLFSELEELDAAES